ncbi:hypothetical protein ACG74X_00160 [Marivita sp. S0852]|uniref:hypothetical protein n=1 Tax=Marivita sp. S0852 TaxID=3373893 RepID=UPI003981C4B5
MKALIHFEKDPNVPWPVEERRQMAGNLFTESMAQTRDARVAFAVVRDFMKMQGHGEMTPPEFVEWMKAVSPPCVLH